MNTICIGYEIMSGDDKGSFQPDKNNPPECNCEGFIQYAQGQWELRHTNNRDFVVCDKGSLVNGSKSGNWKDHKKNGEIHEGLYKDGWRHGHWKEEYPADGIIRSGNYRYGQKDGCWKVFIDGATADEHHVFTKPKNTAELLRYRQEPVIWLIGLTEL